MIVGDYNGGVQFINSCNESDTFKKEKLQIGIFDGFFTQSTSDAASDRGKHRNRSLGAEPCQRVSSKKRGVELLHQKRT